MISPCAFVVTGICFWRESRDKRHSVYSSTLHNAFNLLAVAYGSHGRTCTCSHLQKEVNVPGLPRCSISLQILTPSTFLQRSQLPTHARSNLDFSLLSLRCRCCRCYETRYNCSCTFRIHPPRVVLPKTFPHYSYVATVSFGPFYDSCLARFLFTTTYNGIMKWLHCSSVLVFCLDSAAMLSNTCLVNRSPV